MGAYRISPQLKFSFGAIDVDNFAGGGGASVGIEDGLGKPVDIAINHDPGAIKMHQVNHPQTRHYCESVWDVDPKEVCNGRPVRLAWFSPDCTHFSKAKGGKPVKKEIRGLAWVVLRWAAKVRPQVIMLENVEEFKTWGPLKRRGKIWKERKGETFSRWKKQLEGLGYVVEIRELRACDYGAPTIRKRLFIIARCDGVPIVWPDPTHGPKGRGLKPYRTAADIIDWSIPCPSIFERKRPLAENTLKRIARGIQKFVIENPEPFIVSYYGPKKDGEFRGQSLSDPLPTQTTENRFALVTPYLTEHANASKQRVMPVEEPLRTQCAQVKGGHFALVAPVLEQLNSRSGGRSASEPLGTATVKNKSALVTAFLAQHNLGATGHEATEPLSTVTARGTQQQVVAAHLVRQFGQSVGSSIKDPTGTITPGGMGKAGIVTSHLLKLRGTCRHGQKVTEPFPTVTGQGLHVGEVRAFLLKYYGTNIGHKCNEPLQTVTSKHRFGLVTVAGEDYQIVDIGMRMLTPRELYRAQGFPENYIIDHDADGNAITKTEQVKRCGNSVCPPISSALVRANIAIDREERIVA